MFLKKFVKMDCFLLIEGCYDYRFINGVDALLQLLNLIVIVINRHIISDLMNDNALSVAN